MATGTYRRLAQRGPSDPSRRFAAATISGAVIPAGAIISAGVPEPGTVRTAQSSMRGGFGSDANASMTAEPRPPVFESERG